MSKFQGMRRISLIVSFSLIIILALLIHPDFTGAGGLGKIGPNQGFESCVLLPSQSYHLSTTQSKAFGIHGINIVSALNEKIDSVFELDRNTMQPGTWVLMLWGVGGGIGGIGGAGGADIKYGLTSAYGGRKTSIDVGSYAYAITLLIINLTSPSEENPLKFKIKIETPPKVM